MDIKYLDMVLYVLVNITSMVTKHRTKLVKNVLLQLMHYLHSVYIELYKRLFGAQIVSTFEVSWVNPWETWRLNIARLESGAILEEIFQSFIVKYLLK